MRRIVVVGCPGNGKSTLAGQLAEGLGLRHIELDSLFHATDWGSASEEEFHRDLVDAMDASPDGWVTCGNYLEKSGRAHLARADTFVWLDLPRPLVTWRTARRTVRRAVTRAPLFGNGLHEPRTNFTRWDPEKNVIRWAWVHHPRYRQQFGRMLTDGSLDHLTVHHLTTTDQIAEFREGALAGQR